MVASRSLRGVFAVPSRCLRGAEFSQIITSPLKNVAIYKNGIAEESSRGCHLYYSAATAGIYIVSFLLN